MDDVKHLIFGMISITLVAAAWVLGFSSDVQAGSFIAASESRGVDMITHPAGYNFSGTNNDLTIKVCIDANSPNKADMEQSVRNIIETYNQLQPTTGNLRFDKISGSRVDFESVALHELGHCIGKAHVNLASESGLTEPDRNYTKSTDGGTAFDIAPGVDGVRGSADDVRGDDVNLHWYRIANNNPFTMDYQVIDSSTYARDTLNLPGGDLFATNGDRTVGSNVLATPNTEAVMQQLTFFGEIQRTLAHDGVATIRYAMAGLDEESGSSDDYVFELQYSNSVSDCDIKLDFDNTETGFAVCKTGFSYMYNQSSIISSANIFFNTGYNWHFNTAAPCTQALDINPNQWTMITLPCLVGLSNGNTVADVFDDDFTGAYGNSWVMWGRNAVTQSYERLDLTSKLHTGAGYWILTEEENARVSVNGQFNGSPDIALTGATGGRPNLVGHPFDFPVKWADVQIVDGEKVQGIAEAALTDGDIFDTFQVWNGNTYLPYGIDTPGMGGILDPFEAIWVSAIKDGIYLRIPNEPYAVSAEIETTGKAAAIDTVADDGSWYVRLIVESGDYIDDGNVLGQLPESQNGKDRHDLAEFPPFGSKYLTAVFLHDDWEGDAWAYASDFRASTRKPAGEWEFAVFSSGDVAEIILRFEGPGNILSKAKVIDQETGKKVKFKNGEYRFDASPGLRYFTFRLGKNR